MPTAAAPRIDGRLTHLIERHAGTNTAAELTRLVGNTANTLGLVRPSYQQVRVIRLRFVSKRKPKPAGGVSTLAVVLDVVFHARPAYDVVDFLADGYLPYRPAATNLPRRGS